MKDDSNFGQVLPWFTIIEKMRKERSYKPVLLLSIIAEIEHGSIQENEVVYSKAIEDRFNAFYDAIGNKQGIGKSNIPFYHLQSDVWSFERSSPNLAVSRSKSSLQKDIKYAKFKSTLFELLKEDKTRDIIKERLFLKVEEDIKTIDVRRNDYFKPPNNIDDVIRSQFGKIANKHKTDYSPKTTLEFETERLLQDTLVKNWTRFPQFHNWNIYEGPPSGVEFRVDEAGRIDILAESKKGDKFKVIELKRSLGKREHLGQLLQYMGWIRTKFADGQGVFGLLIASDFKEGMKYAMDRLDSIDLMKYDLNLKLSSISL